MAVNDEATVCVTCLLLCGLTLVAPWPSARAEAPTVAAGAVDSPLEPAGLAARNWWRDGASRVHGLLREAKQRVRHSEPDWLRYRQGNETPNAPMSAAGGDLCLVLQEDRPDGTDLVTARYTLHEGGALRTYAGAGLNRAQYFHDAASDPGPTWFDKRNRRTSMGAAAELGAEVRMSERVLLNADLRWVELDDRAEALRTDHGPVAADPLMVGLTVGYRFR